MKRIHTWILDTAIACFGFGIVVLLFGGLSLNLAGGLLLAFSVVLFGILLGVAP